MKRYTILIVLLGVVLLLAGCMHADAAGEDATSAIIDTALPSYDLLQDVALELPENITREDISESRAYFYSGGVVIGGIEVLDIAGQRDTLPFEDDYADLAITVTNLVYTGEYDRSVDKNSGLADVEVGIKFRDGRTFCHYFFFGEKVVYDIWADHDVLDGQDMISILKTLHSEDIINPQDSNPANADTPILNLRIDMPEGMICVPATTTQLLFFDVPWDSYSDRGNAVGGVEAVTDADDLEALESVISALGKEHLGGEYTATAQVQSGSNVIAKVTASSSETELVSFVVEVENEIYAVWANTAVIAEEDILRIAEDCSY